METTRGENGVIVVGVDGSAGAERALRWAAPEAARTGATLRVVHVWRVPTMSWPDTAGAAYLDPIDLKEGGQRIVQRAASFVRRNVDEPGLVIEEVTLEGPTAPGLFTAAEGASMLVVGTRGRGGFASLVLGSTASACAHHTPVPLVVVGPESPPPGVTDIVVGFDDSPGGRAALGWAGAAAARHGSLLRVVHGWDIPVAPAGAPTFSPLVDPEELVPAHRALDASVAEVLGQLPVVPRSTVAIVGMSAPDALTREAKSAALLVVGSRGRGGFAGLLLGSVSQQCIHHASCPVVIVPTPPH